MARVNCVGFLSISAHKKTASWRFFDFSVADCAYLVAHTACYCGYNWGSIWFGALEAEFNRLAWLDGFIPIQICDRVRVASAQCAIPQVGYASCIGVVPADVPRINGG